MPISCSGPRPFAGDLFIPGTIAAALERVRTEMRPILVRRTTDGTYEMLVQAEDEIDPLEDMRRKPVLYCAVDLTPWGRVVISYADGRVETP
jgi:hypothetical protein